MGDREDNGDNPNIPPFNVQGPDEGPVIHGVLPGGPGAPSRPPSRSQSPLGRMLEWSAQTNAASMQVPAPCSVLEIRTPYSRSPF